MARGRCPSAVTRSKISAQIARSSFRPFSIASFMSGAHCAGTWRLFCFPPSRYTNSHAGCFLPDLHALHPGLPHALRTSASDPLATGMNPATFSRKGAGCALTLSAFVFMLSIITYHIQERKGKNELFHFSSFWRLQATEPLRSDRPNPQIGWWAAQPTNPLL